MTLLCCGKYYTVIGVTCVTMSTLFKGLFYKAFGRQGIYNCCSDRPGDHFQKADQRPAGERVQGDQQTVERGVLMKKSGQITVFLSMVLLCIAALLGALMESARTAGARCYLRIAADSALDSVMAGYHRGLWERYRILLREFGGEEELSEEFKRYFDGYLEAAGWYPAQTEELLVEEAVPVTADGGAHLQQEVIDYMKYGVWALDFTEAEAGDVLDGLREASAVQETSRLYGTCSGKALQLERTVERINSLQQEQQELRSAGLRQLAAGDGSGFLQTGRALIKVLEEVPGAVADYGEKADALQAELEEVYRQVEVKMQDMTPQMEAAAREEYERYQSYTARDGERRGEIEALADLAGENLALTQSVMREAEDVMDYIDSWEGEEDEELDEDALWRPVRRHMEGFAVRILACAHGTADKEKQSFLENIGKIAEDGLLALVLPEGTPISGEEMLGGTASGGSHSSGASGGLAERLFTGEYCGQFFRHFLDEAPENEMGMAYQMEYLVCGEMEDRENLGEAAARLLALREGLNLIHILGDAGKRAQARELAAVIVGASGLLPLVEVVAVLVMGVWALGEALADVKALFAGGKVPLIKSGEDWKLSLDQLLALGAEGQLGAETQEKGLGYESYLKLLLFAAEPETLLYRMMDMMQDTIGREEPGFLMEKCAYRVELCAVTGARHLFSLRGAEGYRIQTRIGRSY